MTDFLTADEVLLSLAWTASRIAELRARWRGCRQRVSVLPLDDPRRKLLVNFLVSDADPS